MGHEHQHRHLHEAHTHSARAFGIGVALNLGLVGVQVVYGVVSHSMALVADAGHNLGDVLGLGLASGAALLAQRKPTKHRTYGYRRLTVFAALANAILLVLATGAVMWESVRRLRSPEVVDAQTVIWVALAGAVVNGVSALLFFDGRREDLNVRAAFVHLVGDAAISLGVVGASFVMLRTGWLRVDSVAAIVVSLLILASTWSLLRSSLNLVLDAVPEGIDIDAVRAFLQQRPNVREVHDLHVWAMSTTETALTAHLVMPTSLCGPTFLSGTCRELHERFGIEHATLQVDPAEAPDPCKLAPDEIV
ncbi:MAG TPA: cation diffusion facilitator family transporter [Polyangiaceae bacterium]|nr:cation diffusion facilitator family transporter [Polyangiaceae bacterium]